jgi:hypothetical protein
VLIANQEDGNAGEELITAHLATASPGPEDGVLPPPDPRCSSPNPTLSDRSDPRGDDDRKDAPSAEGARRWMEWAEMDVEELLADLDDDEDLTDRHWKRGADDQPTASGASHQDSRDEHDQATEPRRPGTTLSSPLVRTFCAAISPSPPQGRIALPSAVSPQTGRARRSTLAKSFIRIRYTSHLSLRIRASRFCDNHTSPYGKTRLAGQLSQRVTRERVPYPVSFLPGRHACQALMYLRPLPAERPTERQPWARGRENQRNDVRRGWGRSSNKRSHNHQPYQPRDTHRRSEAERHHTRQHTHHAPPQNWRSSPTHNYSQQHGHNKHMGTTPNEAHGRKRSRERTYHFTRWSDARQAHHHHPGLGRDKRTRREDKPEQGPPA